MPNDLLVIVAGTATSQPRPRVRTARAKREVKQRDAASSPPPDNSVSRSARSSPTSTGPSHSEGELPFPLGHRLPHVRVGRDREDAGTPPTIPSPRRTKRTWTSSRRDPGAVRALAYDVVLNGTELGSGSIRIHRQDIQSIIFKALGMSPEEQQPRFGFFLEALQYGTPPHGGIALGLDRIVMILAGAPACAKSSPSPRRRRPST